MSAGLIDTITLSFAPVLIGGGAPLFGALTDDVELELLKVAQLPAEFAQLTYRVVKGAGES